MSWLLLLAAVACKAFLAGLVLGVALGVQFERRNRRRIAQAAQLLRPRRYASWGAE